MAKKKKLALSRSCAWILANPEATNHEVPDDLWEYWVFGGSAFQFTVFVFGYFHAGHFTTVHGRPAPPDSLVTAFFSWQLKLGLSHLHKNSQHKQEPMPLWRFSGNEHVKYAGSMSKSGGGEVPRS